MKMVRERKRREHGEARKILGASIRQARARALPHSISRRMNPAGSRRSSPGTD